MKKETDRVIDKVISGMDWDVIFDVNKCFKHGVGDGVSVIPGVKRKAFADGITKNDLKNELKSLLKYVIENNIPELIYGYWMIFWDNPLWTEEYLNEIKEEMEEEGEDIMGEMVLDPTLEVIYSPQRMYLIANNIKNEPEEEKQIKKQLHEEFTVIKPNTVVHPGAMMIHIQHTYIADRAMMASLWLKCITYQAVSLSLVFFISNIETPI